MADGQDYGDIVFTDSESIYKNIDKKITIFDLILKDIKNNSLINNNFLDTAYIKTGIPKYFFHKINTKTPYIILFENNK